MTGNSRPNGLPHPAPTHFDYARVGNSHIVSEEYTIAAGDSDSLHLKNPSGNGRTVLFKDVLISATRASTVKVHDDFSSAPSGGSTASIQNALLDAENGTIDGGTMEANRSVSYTADSTHITTVLGGGQSKESVGSTGEAPLFAMEPGREIVVEVTNDEVDPEDATMTITYSEVGRVFSQT